MALVANMEGFVESVGRKRSGVGWLIMVGLLAFAILFVRGQSHADGKHVEAPSIRSAYNNRVCEGTEMWFSPTRGTIMILCGLPESNLWGGLIFRVTENMGQSWLGSSAYEASAFAAQRYYWRKVIRRDSYMPLMNFPNVARMFEEWYR